MSNRTPWANCEVSFQIRNPEATYSIGPCSELPAGWTVSRTEPAEEQRCFMLVFEVQGDVLASDGFVVQRILDRMGC